MSRGEYERIFSRLFRVPLKTIKKIWVTDKDGNKKRVVFHPVMTVMNDKSPKFLRKHRDTMGRQRSRRARTEYAFAGK